MNWLYILLVLAVALLIYCVIGAIKCLCRKHMGVTLASEIAIVLSLIPIAIVKSNIESKHDWYVETRLKYAEAEGIEKEYLEMTDVMTYNLWYERNKEDLEDPWSFKSVARCEFDYIKVGD